MEENKRITIYDIAREAEISPSMVSRVLSGKGSVSPKTKERIQAIIDKYDFKPNAIARGLQKSSSRIIGFMIPHIENEYFSKVYYEFEKHASENGYITILYNGKNDPATEHRILNMFEEFRVEAAILMGGNIDALNVNPGYAEAVATLNKKIPCILCSEQAEKFGCVGVHTDSRKIAALAVEHAVEKGYSTMGILGGSNDRFPSVYLRDTFMEYAREKGIEIRPEWIHGNSYNPEDGMKAMRELLSQKERPRALFCLTDYVAVGAMSEAMDAGLRIPEDMAFIGNDNIQIGSIVRPHLTTIGKDFAELGTILFQMMMDRLGNKEVKSCTTAPHLVEREST